MKSIMNEIASDGREGFRTQDGFKSSAAIRAWCARN